MLAPPVPAYVRCMTSSPLTPDAAVPSESGDAVDGGHCRLRFEGPASLLGVVVHTLRDCGITITSVYVAGSAANASAHQEHLLLALLCEGNPDSLQAALRLLRRGLGNRADLAPVA